MGVSEEELIGYLKVLVREKLEGRPSIIWDNLALFCFYLLALFCFYLYAEEL